MRPKMTFGFVLTVILIAGIGSIVFAEDRFQGQQFTFMSQEAYTQEKDSWQVSFTSQYLDRKTSRESDDVTLTSQWEWTAEVEYGLTDWLQFEAEIPFTHVKHKTTEDGESTHISETDIGDVETGVRIRLFGEDRDVWWSHTVSAGFVVIWPSASWREDFGADRFGVEASLAMSKTYDNWAYHLSGGFGLTDDTREQGESSKTDVEAFELGAALVYSPTDKTDFIGELSAEFEREKTNRSENSDTEFYFIPGIKYEPVEDLEAGIGVPIGLTACSYDWGFIAKIQYEW